MALPFKIDGVPIDDMYEFNTSLPIGAQSALSGSNSPYKFFRGTGAIDWMKNANYAPLSLLYIALVVTGLYPNALKINGTKQVLPPKGKMPMFGSPVTIANPGTYYLKAKADGSVTLEGSGFTTVTLSTATEKYSAFYIAIGGAGGGAGGSQWLQDNGGNGGGGGSVAGLLNIPKYATESKAITVTIKIGKGGNAGANGKIGQGPTSGGAGGNSTLTFAQNATFPTIYDITAGGGGGGPNGRDGGEGSAGAAAASGNSNIVWKANGGKGNSDGQTLTIPNYYPGGSGNYATYTALKTSPDGISYPHPYGGGGSACGGRGGSAKVLYYDLNSAASPSNGENGKFTIWRYK